MTQIKLVMTDMDHTLLTEESELPEGLETRLAALKGLGIKFGIASGRPIYTLRDIFPHHQHDFAFIADNGGAIYNGKKLLEMSDLPETAIKEMVLLGLETPGIRPMICARDAAVVLEEDQPYDAVYREFYRQIDYIDDLLAWQGDANKVTYYLPEANAQEVYEGTIAPKFGADYDVVVSGSVWIDITPHGVNKGAALKTLGEELGIELDAMLVFGDAQNDAAMLQEAGYGFLMENALPAMEPFGQFRAPANTEAGVLTILDALIEGEGAASSLMRFSK